MRAVTHANLVRLGQASCMKKSQIPLFHTEKSIPSMAAIRSAG
jgi:hypothetical protein